MLGVDEAAMVDLVGLELNEGYALLRPQGPITVPRLLLLLKEAMGACQARGVTRLLMDGTSLTHRPITLPERFQMASELELFWDRGTRLAFVGGADQIDAERFDALVTSNRGLPIGFFATEADAVNWLVGTPEV
jgi:hypothetical protein